MEAFVYREYLWPGVGDNRFSTVADLCAARLMEAFLWRTHRWRDDGW